MVCCGVVCDQDSENQRNNTESSNKPSLGKSGGRKSRRKKNQPVDDSHQCLYCQRCFSSQKGLSQHLNYCKIRNVLPESNQPERVLCKGCGRSFDTERGMKIHQTKTRCGIGDSFDNTCMSQDNQSEVLASQEQNHSATSCLNSSNESQILQKVGKKPPILWPKMKDDNKYIDYQRQVYL